MQFTKDQKRVIDARKKNILVSAAAGSGKTAVLVERIIQMVVDEKEPVDIDRLLIVTFTSAAAAEMRERIFAAINSELLKRPESEHLQRQAALIHNAKITTIHSFCLEVIRNYFGEIGLDPGFRIADEGELKLLKKDVMADLLEEAYKEADEHFLHFVETYSRGNHDKALEELIAKVYEFTMSFPMPEEYLERSLLDTENLNEQTVLESPYMEYLLDYVKNVLAGLKVSLENALKMTETSGGPYMYAENLEKDMAVIDDLLKVCSDYRVLADKISQVKFGTLSRKADSSVSEQKKECVKAIRTDVKDTLKKLCEKFFFTDFAEMIACEQYAGSALNTLFSLVQQYSQRLIEAKQEKNIIDFSDMEHYALKILVHNENGVMVPTKAAMDYQNYFTEIIVDEYQDSNLVQEYILEAVSGEKNGNFNRFMVGDVKQSIYRFRLARPELFMEKYESYPDRISECEVIDLSMNFRSRREVLDTTNTVFSKIMDSSFGGITYDESAALYYGANYYPVEGNYDSELLLIEKPEKDDLDNAKEREASVIAHKIKEFVGKQLVYDKKTEKTRYASYKDIVILLRSNKGWDDVFKKVLESEMIPCHTESKSGYFDTVEVRNVIEFLKVIDNPKQDIPLYGVMTSVFGGFSDEEMATIKGVGKQMDHPEDLYDTVKWYAMEHTDVLAQKVSDFLEMIQEYRMKARFMPIRQLLQQLFTQFHYVAVVSAMKGGEQRRANVELLLQKASAYEKTSYFGAFHFIRYLQQIMEKEVEYGEADLLDENADVVRIMSIHKSKGLEFPICFVAGLGKKMNFMDAYQVLVADSDLGVGSECIRYEKRLQSKTLSKNVIVQKMLNDSLAEEIRVLYVAFTRAREKLILSGTVSNIGKKLVSLMKYAGKGGKLPYTALSTVTSAMDFVLMALADNKGMEDIYRRFDIPVDFPQMNEDEKNHIQIQCIDKEGLTLLETGEELEEAFEQVVFEKEVYNYVRKDAVEEIKERLDDYYGHSELANLYTKTTVSELKKAAFPVEEGAKLMFEEEREEVTIPKFMKKEEKVLGTTRGTAFHKVMEVFPFERFLPESKITEEMIIHVLKEQAENGKLPEEYIPLVSIGKIMNFLASDLAKRMMVAAREGKLYKEQPFVYGIGADRLNKEFPATETVLIQGIIDAYFEEDDKLVLLDYKTDVVDSEEALVKRYQVQLDYYGEVLEKLLSKTLKDVVIYSFCFEKEIKLQNSR
ncbi:MAG: helicase-exonuclease AddAB subunit AddA [Lachnospiraceae bacterium]|nr:helicase-exonuclease AddAB subunit AddA [Lachnospiraceae bacterium]